jgi:hypothetical protein
MTVIYLILDHSVGLFYTIFNIDKLLTKLIGKHQSDTIKLPVFLYISGSHKI